MAEWIVLGKREIVEFLKSFSAGNVASARLNIFGLRHRVALHAR